MDQSWTQNNKFWGNSSFRFFFTLDSCFFFWWFSVRHRYFCDDFPPFFSGGSRSGFWNHRSQKILNISGGFSGNSSFRFFFDSGGFFFLVVFGQAQIFLWWFPPFFLVVLEYCGYYRSQKIQNISDGFQEIHRFDFLTRVFFFWWF